MARGIATHIGLNVVDPGHYDEWDGKLEACEADAESMTAISSAAGFETSTLLTAGATRSNVERVISAAAATLTAGDIYLITYAGHGGQVPDLDDDEPSVDDEEPDGLDETWCLYDGQMIDDELSVLWGDFAHGVRILVVSDSCHSGTVIKAPREAVHPGPPARPATNAAAGGIRYRFMPPQVAAGTYRKNERFYEGILSGLRNLFGADPDRRAGRIGASVRLLSGCKDHQFAMDGNVNGLFTGRLLRVWDQGAFDGTYEEFHQQIVALMPSSQTPNHTTVGPDHPAFDAERPFTI